MTLMYLNTDLAIPCQGSRFLGFLQSHSYLYNLYKIQGSLGAMRDLDRCIIPVGEVEVKSSSRKKKKNSYIGNFWSRLSGVQTTVVTSACLKT